MSVPDAVMARMIRAAEEVNYAHETRELGDEAMGELLAAAFAAAANEGWVLVKLEQVGWHCAHGFTVRQGHADTCKTRDGLSGVIGPLYKKVAE